MRMLSVLTVLVAAVGVAACGGNDEPRRPDGGKADDPSERPAAGRDLDRDMLSTRVEANVAELSGTATITVAPSDSRALSLEIGDLTIVSVSDDFGALETNIGLATLDIGVPATGDPNTVVIEYTYLERDEFEGALDNGITLTWPYYCGNLFPCKSDPSDGLELELELTGVPTADTAVYPEAIVADAPAYMLAWAIGDYTYQSLGTTTAGTEVGVYYLPGEETIATTGTENLPALFEWMETTLGPYTFGTRVASVSAPWGAGAFGGMEHHPLWHVGTAAMGDEETHAHEAAHGWYGNGVRIECWEDFVLSEGTVSYLTARSIEVVRGTIAGDAVWEGYRGRLASVADGLAWPQGCGQIDIIDDGLFSSAPYMKGAFFFKSLAAKIGAETLDAILADFYRDHVGGAAAFQELLDFVEAETGYDPDSCADSWLRAEALPESEVCP
ncbi:MAG: peptidase M1 [Deltaproteobacteria bacterium]|nr:peptidase M1 [Deltaproteobacteria bacterium]